YTTLFRSYLPFQNIMDARLKYYRDLIMYAQLECDNVRPIVEKRQLLVHVICLHPQGIVDASLGSSLAPPFAFASNLALLSVDSLVNESPVVGWLLHLRHLLRDFLVYQRVQDLSDRKSTRLNSSHVSISYAVFCLRKKRQYA